MLSFALDRNAELAFFVRVRFLSGDIVELKNAECVAEARRHVAAVCGVCPTQVTLAYGTKPLLDAKQLLRDFGCGCELSAVVAARPCQAAIVPQGAGFYHFRFLHVSRPKAKEHCSLRAAVKLPPGVGPDQWIAAQTCLAFEHVAVLPKLMQDVCTCETCPLMCAGRDYVYVWTDENGDNPHEISAPEYMDRLLARTQALLTSTTMVPPGYGNAPFPEQFMSAIRVTLRRLFHIYAHAYLNHYAALKKRGILSYITWAFRHFVFFVSEFNLVGANDLLPLEAYIERVVRA